MTTLLIHGGAGSGKMSAAKFELVRASVERILMAVYPQLANGCSALDAAVLAVSLLEDDPLYNAGKGSKIQSDGHIRMSASVMDGKTRRFAGCVNVERVKNPVGLAQALLPSKDRVLAGKGAAQFARTKGLAFASPFTEERRREFLAHKSGKTGTVGAVALDRKGRLAAATSTGGRGFEYPHRVSDTPTTAGNYANSVCAVSATGVGEEIVDFAAASTICAYVEAGFPLEKAVQQVLGRARRVGAQFGVIALDRTGGFRAQTTTESLIWGVAGPNGMRLMRKRG